MDPLPQSEPPIYHPAAVLKVSQVLTATRALENSLTISVAPVQPGPMAGRVPCVQLANTKQLLGRWTAHHVPKIQHLLWAPNLRQPACATRGISVSTEARAPRAKQENIRMIRRVRPVLKANSVLPDHRQHKIVLEEQVPLLAVRVRTIASVMPDTPGVTALLARPARKANTKAQEEARLADRARLELHQLCRQACQSTTVNVNAGMFLITLADVLRVTRALTSRVPGLEYAHLVHQVRPRILRPPAGPVQPIRRLLSTTILPLPVARARTMATPAPQVVKVQVTHHHHHQVAQEETPHPPATRLRPLE